MRLLIEHSPVMGKCSVRSLCIPEIQLGGTNHDLLGVAKVCVRRSTVENIVFPQRDAENLAKIKLDND